MQMRAPAVHLPLLSTTYNEQDHYHRAAARGRCTGPLSTLARSFCALHSLCAGFLALRASTRFSRWQAVGVWGWGWGGCGSDSQGHSDSPRLYYIRVTCDPRRSPSTPVREERAHFRGGRFTGRRIDALHGSRGAGVSHHRTRPYRASHPLVHLVAYLAVLVAVRHACLARRAGGGRDSPGECPLGRGASAAGGVGTAAMAHQREWVMAELLAALLVGEIGGHAPLGRWPHLPTEC